MITTKQNTSAGDMEVPWTAKLEGCKVEGMGDTEEEAKQDLVRRINVYIQFARKIQKLVLDEVGIA